jgi:hypothetical protein
VSVDINTEISMSMNINTDMSVSMNTAARLASDVVVGVDKIHSFEKLMDVDIWAHDDTRAEDAPQPEIQCIERVTDRSASKLSAHTVGDSMAPDK